MKTFIFFSEYDHQNCGVLYVRAPYMPENTVRIWKVLSALAYAIFCLTDTEMEEAKDAEKRVRVYCGICKETRYYSIHRGVTRIGGVVLACEACRHYYQKFKRQPCILRCRDKDSGRCVACSLLYCIILL